MGWSLERPHDSGPKSVAAMTARLELFALPGLPMVRAGDDLPALILAGLDRAGEMLRDRDVVVIAQKIVSKAEGPHGRSRSTLSPSAQAIALAAEVGKDPRIVEVVLSEVDEGRAQPAEPDDHAAPTGLRDGQRRCRPVQRRGIGWPPPRPAAAGRSRRFGRGDPGRAGGRSGGCGRRDQRQLRPPLAPWHRRAWRSAAPALPSLIDLRGQPDLFGRKLEVSIIGFADEIAAAASLLQGQAAGRSLSSWCAA